MPLPRIAIVGRPNVGKSSLLNMLASRRVSIVDDTPGTTRDRVSAIVRLEGEDPADPAIEAEITDTGGYGVYTVEGRRIDDAGHDLANLTGDIERQIAHAVESADLILFVVDAQTGITPQDREVARLLREGGMAELAEGGTTAGNKAEGGAVDVTGKVLMIANKTDGPSWEADALEASALGFGEPMIVSAKINYNRRHLVERLHALMAPLVGMRTRGGKAAGRNSDIKPVRSQVSSAFNRGDAPAEMMLAIVGKRNAGKSTLVNTLAGEDRVIVSEIPGTTRDAVDVRFEMDGRAFVAIDTAGLRKKKSFADRIEWFALDRLQLAVRRCDVALLLIDATTPISQVDQQIGHMLAQSYKPVVIVVNKWDLAEGQPLKGGSGRAAKKGARVTPEVYETYIREELKGLWYAPLAFISGQEGVNVKETIELGFELMRQAHERATTGKLNRMLRKILEQQGPANKLGTFAKVFYVAQIRTAPPTIVCVVNRPELFTPNYQRFLLNRFREELPFPEVPIRLIIRGRTRDLTNEEIVSQAEEQLAGTGELAGAASAAVGGRDSAGAESEGGDVSMGELSPDVSSYFDDEPLESDEGDTDGGDERPSLKSAGANSSKKAPAFASKTNRPVATKGLPTRGGRSPGGKKVFNKGSASKPPSAQRGAKAREKPGPKKPGPKRPARR